MPNVFASLTIFSLVYTSSGAGCLDSWERYTFEFGIGDQAPKVRIRYDLVACHVASVGVHTSLRGVYQYHMKHSANIFQKQSMLSLGSSTATLPCVRVAAENYLLSFGDLGVLVANRRAY